MISVLTTLLATFTSPEELGTNPRSLLWFLPLSAAIAVVYKTAKLPKIKKGILLSESVTLFGSIVIFMVLIGMGLLIFSWLVTE